MLVPLSGHMLANLGGLLGRPAKEEILREANTPTNHLTVAMAENK